MNFEKYSKNDLTKILLNVLEMDEKDTDKILNIFIFGSILYKTATENSDIDVLVVIEDDCGPFAKQPSSTDKRRDGLDEILIDKCGENGDIDFNIVTRSQWNKSVIDHSIRSFMCMMMDSRFKIKETLVTPYLFTYSYLSKSLAQFVKCHKKKSNRIWKTSERKAKKTLMHAMRQVLLSRQLLKTHGAKFLDFEEGNDFYRQFVLQYEAEGKNSNEKWENTKTYFEKNFEELYENVQKEINIYEEYNKWDDKSSIIRYLVNEKKTKEEMRRELSISCVEREPSNYHNNQKNGSKNEDNKKDKKTKIIELHADKYYSSTQSNLTKESRCSALIEEDGQLRFACLPTDFVMGYVHVNQRMWSTVPEWKKKEMPKINEKALETINWEDGKLRCYVKPNSIMIGMFFVDETKTWDIVAYVDSAYAYSYVRRYDIGNVSQDVDSFERHKFVTMLVRDKFWNDWNELGFSFPTDISLCYHFFYHPDQKSLLFYFAKSLLTRDDVSLDVAQLYNWKTLEFHCEFEKVPRKDVLNSLYKSVVNICPVYNEGFIIVDKDNHRMLFKHELYDNIEDVLCPHIQLQVQVKRNILLALCLDLSDTERQHFVEYFPLIQSSFVEVFDTYYQPYFACMESTWNKIKDLEDVHQVTEVIPQRPGYKILFNLKKYEHHNLKIFLKLMNNPNVRKNIIEFVSEK